MRLHATHLAPLLGLTACAGLLDLDALTDGEEGTGGAATATAASTGGAGPASSSSSGTAGSGGSSAGGGGGGMATSCAVDELQDGFDSVTLDTTKWATWGSLSGTGVSSGTYRIPLAINSPGNNYAGIRSLTTNYDFHGCAVWLEAVEVPDNAADEAESFLRVAADSLSRQIRIGNENGLTYYSIRENGSNVVYLDLPYNPSAHRWWRIREGGGMIHWEVSPDGLMWTQLNAAITPSWVDSIEINIGAGTYGTENVPGDFAFDNVNAPP